MRLFASVCLMLGITGFVVSQPPPPPPPPPPAPATLAIITPLTGQTYANPVDIVGVTTLPENGVAVVIGDAKMQPIEAGMAAINGNTFSFRFKNVPAPGTYFVSAYIQNKSPIPIANQGPFTVNK